MTIKLATFYTVVVMADPKVLLQPSSIYGESAIKHPRAVRNIAKVCTWFLPTVG